MTQAIFKFKSNAPGGDQFTVVSFSGYEAISNLYRYEIELKAPVMAEIDLDDVLDATATFITDQDGIEYPVHGVLSSFEEVRFVQNYSYYKAILVPRIWKLSNYKTNEIYYKSAGVDSVAGGQCIDTIIHQVLEKANLASSDYDIDSLQGSLLNREYVCQYNESDFDFISRLMENEGVFYYFEQGEVEEKIIFINDLNYLSIPRPKLVFDVAAQSKNQDDCVYALSCRKQRLPENVIVRDYNPDEASLDVSDTTTIDIMGQGTEYIYGKNVKTDSEATYLSQIRAEEYICRKTIYFGESSVTRLLAGHLFVLDGHPNTNYNSFEYLAVEVNHEGTSLDMSLAGTGDTSTKPQYQNSFVAIPADVQYRPPRKTPKPRITGTIHARIDGELDSKYAQLDDQGRYKVSLPFDFHNEAHPEGLASARVRMMQPYAGKNRGMQFPMAKGTEVLLSFIDGDPDRPIIAGAINSVSAPGPVTADNQTESVIQTGGNNKIRMEDEAGSERIVMQTPMANSWIRVGAHNDPPTINGPGVIALEEDATWTDPGAVASDGTTKLTATITDSSNATKTPAEAIANAGTYTYTYTDPDSGDTATRTMTVYAEGAYSASAVTDTSGIRIRSAASLYLEAQSRYGEYHGGKPTDVPWKNVATDPNEIGELLANFGNGYNPTNLIKHSSPTTIETVEQAIASAHVRVSSLDTFTTQEGNIYDFGGYWNYNLGNSYAEDHIEQKANLNNRDADDLLNVGGPQWDSVIWPDAKGADNKLDGIHWEAVTDPVTNEKKNSGEVWVQKKWGNDYEYHVGDSISVTKGSSLEVEHGGKHVEVSYRDTGSLKSWSVRGVTGGPAEEKKWNGRGTLVYHSTTLVTDDSVSETETKYDRSNGAMYSYSGSSGSGMTYSGFDFNFSNGATASIDAGFRSESGLYLLGKNTNSVFVGIKMDIDLALAGALKIENDGITFSAPGFTSETKTTVVDTKAVQIKALGSKLNAHINEVDSNISRIENNVADIEAAVIHLMS